MRETQGAAKANAVRRLEEGLSGNRERTEGSDREREAQAEAQEGNVAPALTVVGVYDPNLFGLLARCADRFMQRLKAADPGGGRPYYVTLDLPNPKEPVGRHAGEVNSKWTIMPNHLQYDGSDCESADIEGTRPKLFFALLRHGRQYLELAHRAYLQCRDKATPGLVLVNFPPTPKPYDVIISRALRFIKFVVNGIRNNALVVGVRVLRNK